MFLDPNAGTLPYKRYKVRSLYFDTYDYRAFQQKLSGDCERVKL